MTLGGRVQFDDSKGYAARSGCQYDRLRLRLDSNSARLMLTSRHTIIGSLFPWAKPSNPLAVGRSGGINLNFHAIRS